MQKKTIVAESLDFPETLGDLVLHHFPAFSNFTVVQQLGAKHYLALGCGYYVQTPLLIKPPISVFSAASQHSLFDDFVAWR